MENSSKSKRRILWISLFAPHSKANEAGSKTFSYYFRRFADLDKYDITLIAFDAIENKAVIEEDNKKVAHTIFYRNKRNLLDNIKRLINVESRFNPWNKYGNTISTYTSILALKRIKVLHSEGFTPDLVILEWTEMVMLAAEIKKLWPSCLVVASEHDVKYIGYARKISEAYGINKILRTMLYENCKRYELDSLRKCDLVLPQNKDNIQILREEGVSKPVIHWLVPYYQSMNELQRHRINQDVLFFGAMNREENYLSALWFIENVLPKLDKNIRFVVLGGHPPKRLLEKQSERIVVTGFVSDIRSYFEESMCMVAPLVLGAGIKVKVLEGMSAGIPVLTNKIGIEGIQGINGVNYLHCEAPDDYVTAIHKLYRKQLDGVLIGLKAKEIIDKNYDIEKSFILYYQDLENLLN